MASVHFCHCLAIILHPSERLQSPKCPLVTVNHARQPSHTLPIYHHIFTIKSRNYDILLWFQWLVMVFIMVLMIINCICVVTGGDTIILLYYSFIASSDHGFIQSLTSDILILFVLISLTYQLFIAPSTRNILSISSLAGDIIIVSLTGEVFIVAAGDPIISSPSHPFVVSSGSMSRNIRRC
eukprot:366904_1